MEIRPYRKIKRRKTKLIKVGKVEVGGNSKITVQSMTNTLTTDIKETINQILELEKSGADIVRVSCPDEASTAALKDITKEINVPIVADIHFHHKRAIEAAKMGADVCTLPPTVLRQLFTHPLTSAGLAAFLSDWAETGQQILDP